jgi:hypothetical protein
VNISTHDRGAWADRLLALAAAAGIVGVVAVSLPAIGVRSETITIVGLALVCLGSLSMSASFGFRASAARAQRLAEGRFVLISLLWFVPVVLIALRLVAKLNISSIIVLPILVVAFVVFVILLRAHA